MAEERKPNRWLDIVRRVNIRGERYQLFFGDMPLGPETTYKRAQFLQGWLVAIMPDAERYLELERNKAKGKPRAPTGPVRVLPPAPYVVPSYDVDQDAVEVGAQCLAELRRKVRGGSGA